MVLGLGDENLVACSKADALFGAASRVRLRERNRHRVDGIGRIQRPGDLVSVGAHEARHRLARLLVVVGRQASERVRSAVHGGVVLLEECALGIQHRSGTLRGRTRVEVDERMPVHLLRQDREVAAQLVHARLVERHARHSHSMVPGGFEVTSTTTRLISSTLVGDSVRDLCDHVVGQPGPVGGHGILGRDGAEHDRVTIRATITLDTDGTNTGKQNDGALPDLKIESGRGEFFADNEVGLAQNVETFAGDLADDADAEAGAREGLTTDDVFGDAKLAANRHGPHP